MAGPSLSCGRSPRRLGLEELFPADLRELAHTDFEAAYSRLFDHGDPVVSELDALIGKYVSELRLPEEPNLYDYLNLCLRAKDVIFTFNWDPLLVQSQLRLHRAGIDSIGWFQPLLAIERPRRGDPLVDG